MATFEAGPWDPHPSKERALPQQGGASWGREEHLVPAEVEEGQPQRQRVAAPLSGAGGAGGQSGPGQLPASPPEPGGEGLALPRPWSLSLPHSGSSHLALSESLLSLHPGAPRAVDTLSPARRTQDPVRSPESTSAFLLPGLGGEAAGTASFSLQGLVAPSLEARPSPGRPSLRVWSAPVGEASARLISPSPRAALRLPPPNQDAQVTPPLQHRRSPLSSSPPVAPAPPRRTLG